MFFGEMNIHFAAHVMGFVVGDFFYQSTALHGNQDEARITNAQHGRIVKQADLGTQIVNDPKGLLLSSSPIKRQSDTFRARRRSFINGRDAGNRSTLECVFVNSVRVPWKKTQWMEESEPRPGKLWWHWWHCVNRLKHNRDFRSVYKSLWGALFLKSFTVGLTRFR